MTATYTPSAPGDAERLERLARQAQEGVSLDDARELVLRAYMAGFAAGVGEYVNEPRVLIGRADYAVQIGREDPETGAALPAGVEGHDPHQWTDSAVVAMACLTPDDPSLPEAVDA